jgi:endonuclease/exonuclease/phosphatase family metal-dependent hydrolase
MIITETESQFPHHYWVKTERTEMNPGCTAEEVAPLTECIETFCSEISPGELASCGLDQCGMEFEATSSACQTCIASNLGIPLEEIIDSCDGGGAAFSYGGRNGLLILSKHPLSQTEHTTLNSTLVQRALLSVQLDIPEAGGFAVHCTHLTSDLSGSIRYSGTEFDSFAAEQSAQIDEMLSWISTYSSDQPQMILGDFNTGPALELSVAELAENYQKLIDAGYTSVYLGQQSDCTYCDQNTLVGRDGNRGQVIDHIFIEDSSSLFTLDRVETHRTFDQLHPISFSEGEDRMLHISDHYGVQAIFSFSSLLIE